MVPITCQTVRQGVCAICRRGCGHPLPPDNAAAEGNALSVELVVKRSSLSYNIESSVRLSDSQTPVLLNWGVLRNMPRRLPSPTAPGGATAGRNALAGEAEDKRTSHSCSDHLRVRQGVEVRQAASWAMPLLREMLSPVSARAPGMYCPLSFIQLSDSREFASRIIRGGSPISGDSEGEMPSHSCSGSLTCQTGSGRQTGSEGNVICGLSVGYVIILFF